MWGHLNSWRRKVFGRYHRSERGATAVEFALVAAPFFFVLGCICETGLMLFTEYVLQNAVQEASRQVRTGQVSASDGTLLMSSSAFKTSVCNNVKLLIDCTGKVTVYVNNAASFASLASSMANPLTIGGGSNSNVFSPGGKLQPAAVVATYDWDFVFPFMNFLGNVNGNDARRIYGLAIFRNEPF